MTHSLHTNAHPSPPTKRHNVFVKPGDRLGGAEPAVGVEGQGVGVDGWVGENRGGGHRCGGLF